MAARKLGEILAASGELKPLSRAGQRLAELERLLFDAAPRTLAEATRIKSLRAGTLVISADNAAVAAKLRQLVPRVLQNISEREPEVTGIRVEVQPAPLRERASARRAGRTISAAAVAEFQKLAEGLADSPLRSSLERLVRRHKGKVTGDR